MDAGAATHVSQEDAQPSGGALRVAREMIYSPLEYENLTERATRRIAEAIGLGLLEVGERLPSEAELAGLFGIAPMTARESLNALRRTGYLETRRGRSGGTFITKAIPQPEPGLDAGNLAGVELEELRDLTELRVAVSGAATALAAERARDDELDELAGLVETMGAEAHYPSFRRLDTRFHVSIASASRSKRLTLLETTIQSELQALFPMVPHRDEGLGITNGQHRAIVSTLRQRDPDDARRVMEEHARASGEYLVLLWMSARR